MSMRPQSFPSFKSFLCCFPLIASLALGCALITGCGSKNEFVAPPDPEVTVTIPTQREVTEYIEATATAQPTLVVEIRARVKGFLEECLVQEGSRVEAGQLLLVIDEEPFRVVLDQARAGLAEAEAVLQKANQSQAREIVRSQLELDESQLQVAVTEEERLQYLLPSRAVSQEEVDRAVANRKKNEAQVAATKANLTQVDRDYETNIAAAEASVAVAKTTVRQAEINLGYCRITSPIAGRIGRINQDVGNLVGEGQASLLTTVVKYDPIHVYTTINVDDFLKYRKVAEAHKQASEATPLVPMDLALGNDLNYNHHGLIDYHDPMVDKGTGTIQLRGEFPNPDDEILPGMFTRIRIPIATHPDALLVPEPALSIDQSGQFLLVVGADDKVDYRPVQVGQTEEGMRVVNGNIGLTDRVIVEGLLRARPGMKVVPVMETAPVAATSTEGVRLSQSESKSKPAPTAQN